MKGVILTNASASDRSGTDFYPTPENVTVALIKYLGLHNAIVWEPACGAGHMAEAIVRTGNRVIATELYWQGYGLGGVDFLMADIPACDWIITNPPFIWPECLIKISANSQEFPRKWQTPGLLPPKESWTRANFPLLTPIEAGDRSRSPAS